MEDLRRALAAVPREPGKPTALICHTVKGKGVAHIEHDATWHHKSRVSDDEVAALYAALEQAS